MSLARKYSLSLIGVVLLLLLLVPALLLATGPGQRLLLDIAEWALSSEDSRIEIGELEGSLLSEGTISELAIADKTGRWTELERIGFSWSPWRLLSGELDIARLAVDKVVLRRQPGEGDQGEAGQAGGEGGVPLIPLRIDDLSIGELVLEEAVLGQRARLALTGQVEAADPAQSIDASINLRDLDRPNHLRARLDYSAARDTLSVTAEAEETAGGILTTLLDMTPEEGLRFALNGSGPLRDWRGAWRLASNGDRLAGGTMRLDRRGEALRLNVAADGEIGRFVPAPYGALLAGRSDFSFTASRLGPERYRIGDFKLDAPLIDAEAAGTLDLQARRVEGSASLTLGGGAEPVFLQLQEERAVTLRSGTLSVQAEPQADATRLSGTFAAEGLVLNGKRAGRVSAAFSARQPESAAALFAQLEDLVLKAQAEQVVVDDPALAPVVGENLSVSLTGRKDGSRITISDADITAGAGQGEAQGTLTPEGFNGTITLSVPDAQALSQLAGRELSGALQLTARGRAAFDGALDMRVEGQGENFEAGEDTLGKLVAQRPTLQGLLTRREDGAIRLDGFALSSEPMQLRADGGFGPQADGLRVRGTISELGEVLPQSSGTVAVDATIGAQEDGQRRIEARFTAGEATLRGQALRDVTIRYEGSGRTDAQAGNFSASGTIGGKTLHGTGRLAYGGAQQLEVQQFELSLGENRIVADAVLPRSGQARGGTEFTIVDAGEFAPILGVPIEGGLTGRARLSGSADEPLLTVTARSETFRFQDVQLNDLSADLRVRDLLDDPLISGTASVAALSSGETRISAIDVSAEPEDGKTALSLSAQLTDEWQLAGEALVALGAWQPHAVLRNLTLSGGGRSFAQEGEARLVVEGSEVRLSDFVLAADKGRVIATITLGGTLEGEVTLAELPASLAALFAPGPAPTGSIDGSITLAGTTSSPQLDYRLVWNNAGIGDALPPGFPSLKVTATGALRDDTLNVDAALAGRSGLTLKATGQVSDVDGQRNLSLKANGALPLELGNLFLATRGSRLEGRASVELTASGTAADPKVTGRITASGATFFDPPTGLRLRNASLNARLDGETLRIERLTGQSEKGGSFTVAGTVGILQPNLPVDLSIKANELQFNDQRIAQGEANADLTLKGQLQGRSTLAGSLRLSRLDIQIPQTMPAGIAQLELRHVNPPPHVAERLPPEDEPDEKASLPMTIALSVEVSAPNRIFVKGRGLNAQLGGTVRMEGTADEPRPIGEFSLESGRLNIFGRTLRFTSGSLNFSGDLDPILNLVATTEANNTQIVVKVTGRASNPQFVFTSSPELPEDEVLALLLFNKSLGELSPLQIAKLASEVSALGGGTGVLGSLQKSIGLDQLNLVTTESGGTAVSAGSYLNENLYVGVEQNTEDGGSRAKVDLDITKNLKLRGEAGTDGEGKLGIGMEWEY